MKKQNKMVHGGLTKVAAVSLSLAFLSAGLTQLPSKTDATTSTGNKYTVDYQSQEEQRAAGVELAAEVASEGMVLLKNNQNTLPLKGVTNISVFGKRGQDPVFNGSGSGGNSGITTVSLYDGLEAAGFKVNPVLSGMYAGVSRRGNIKTGSSGQSAETIEIEVDSTNYSESVVASYDNYSDAAIIVIGRGGGEGGDLKRANVDGHSDPTEHSLELNDDEKALLAHVKAQKNADGTPKFDKIIYLINTAAAFELTGLQDDNDVDAILWIGMPGGYGMTAVGQILNGAVNPSGHLPAIWAANMKQDPTWFNFGNGNQIYGLDNNGEYGDGYNGTPYVSMYGTANYRGITDANGRSAYRTIDYSEGIYVGYRWYETASTVSGYYVDTVAPDAELPWGVTSVMPNGVTDKYYNRYNGVLYPFGYGLSYTDFEWSVEEPSVKELAANSEITISVTVKNIGSVAGKDVVQLYSNPPYTNGGIEKASANLVTYAKTKELKPGEEQKIELTFNARELASFDYNDANKNGFTGYELESGEYEIALKSNSHDTKGSVTLSVDGGFKYDGSTDALNYNDGYGTTSEAIFSQDDEYNTNRDRWMKDESEGSTSNYVTRADWKLPSAIKANELRFKDEIFDFMTDASAGNATDDKESDKWYKTEVPSDWTQADDTSGRIDGKTAIQLSEMSGIPFEDSKWTLFMNQLTYQEMVGIISYGSYATQALESAGKPATVDADGPTQLGSGNTSWPCEPVQAATFNTELGYAVGRMVGNESILTNRAGWYGPGLNTNRSPFGGRNFEYFSQDGVHSGIYAAAVTKGATDMGVIVYAKHMVLNDQESYRYSAGGVSPWLSEQALREVYMRPWEYVVKYGNCNGAMSSYSKVGAVHSTHNYALNQTLMKDEWGFDGIIVTDMYGSSVSNRWAAGTSGDIAARNGVFPLGSYQSYKRITGQWDTTNKCVVVPKTKTVGTWTNSRPNDDNNNAVYTTTIEYSQEMVPSATQWYWVRNTAQRMLYVVGNSNAMSNLNVYHITFDSNYVGGTNESMDILSGESFATPSDPIRPGYVFAGWFYDAACTEMATVNNLPTQNETYYANWVPAEGAVTVTFNENYYGAPAAINQLVPYGNKTTGYTPSRAGYSFGGWYTDAACTAGNEADLSTAVYQSYVLYAKWTRNSVNVTYNVNGGEGSNIVKEINQNEGLSFNGVTATRTGYQFAGWAQTVRSGWSSVTQYVVPGVTVTADMTLNAQWIAEADDNRTITFNQNYANGESFYIVVANSAAIANGIATPVRNGYTFAGWNTSADGSGEMLATGANGTTFTENATYYAVWNINKYTVTLNQNYAGSPSDSVNTEYGTVISDLEIIQSSPVRQGYTFAGWYTDVDCKIVANLNDAVDSNVVLYASWVINTYDVTFDYNYSGIKDTADVEYGSAPTKPADPVRYGYLFDGWYADAEGSGFALDLSAQVISGDVTFYAKWLENSSKVVYDYNYEGGASYEYTVENGELSPKITDPSRFGYTFDGWYSDAACTVTADFNQELFGNVTYYAKWTVENRSEGNQVVSNGNGTVVSTVVLSFTTLIALSAVVFMIVNGKKKDK